MPAIRAESDCEICCLVAENIWSRAFGAACRRAKGSAEVLGECAGLSRICARSSHNIRDTSDGNCLADSNQMGTDIYVANSAPSQRNGRGCTTVAAASGWSALLRRRCEAKQVRGPCYCGGHPCHGDAERHQKPKNKQEAHNSWSITSGFYLAAVDQALKVHAFSPSTYIEVDWLSVVSISGDCSHFVNALSGEPEALVDHVDSTKRSPATFPWPFPPRTPSFLELVNERGRSMWPQSCGKGQLCQSPHTG